MKQDTSPGIIYTKLNNLGKDAFESAQISSDIKTYFETSGARNKFWSMITGSELSANNKTPYFNKLIECDHAFFDKHQDKYFKAWDNFPEVSGKYFKALLNAANTLDIKNDLDFLLKDMQDNCSEMISPGEIIVATSTLGLFGKESYEGIEKKYINMLGIDLL